jgi:hypothetical protein
MERPADLGVIIDINSLTPNTSYYFISQTTPKYGGVGDFRYNKKEFHSKIGNKVYFTQRVPGEESQVNWDSLITDTTPVYTIKPKGTYGGKRTRKTKHRKSRRRSSRRRN